MKQLKKIVCIGGGHANCQVLKMLKRALPRDKGVEITLINEAPKSYYSGMLPGAVSKLYRDEQIQVEMEPLAVWCKANYIEQTVKAIKANENKILLANGEEVDYDVLAINVGSRTKGAKEVKGVWENSLTTRPINELLPKIQRKEKELLKDNITPQLSVCGAGAAGIELTFGFKQRWSDVFQKDIKTTLISDKSEILPYEHPALRKQIVRKLAEKKIDVIYDARVKEIEKAKVHLQDGRVIDGNVPVWATGAEPQKVTGASDLAMMKGYFRVNDYLQSTSHPNVFASGDCITMESYADRNFPPKAGVYAVREGPFVAQNIVSYITGQQMTPYVPQSGFLALLMTGDGKAIGAKFGISFVGKWVWKMKDYIDVGFMKLFTPKYLFKDYETRGYAEPIENNELFEEEKASEAQVTDYLKKKVANMDAVEAAKWLSCGEEEEDFFERLYIIDKMGRDEAFAKEVVSRFKPPY